MTARRYLDQRLRFHLLRAVDAIERHSSLLKASVALGVSQPALTKSLHELEDILQVRLFDRHSRGVRPTEAGTVFVRSARRILAELHRLDEDLDLLSSPGGGVVALGALPVAAAGEKIGCSARAKTEIGSVHSASRSKPSGKAGSYSRPTTKSSSPEASSGSSSSVRP